MSAIASAFKTIAHAARPALAARQFTRATSALRAPAFKARGFSIATPALAKYGVEKKGEYPSMEFRIFFNEDGKPVSPWHGVPLHNADGTCNFICEIPKETKAKMEVATDEELTPIKQDTKKGKLRDYPYNIHWNYGMLPQTWEDPSHKNEATGVLGDNDPMDVVEIGDVTCDMGGVYDVKPLGVLAMIDDGEIDWKLLAVRLDDPKAAACGSLEEVEAAFPGQMDAIREWFRDYKVPDGKPQNAFGLDEKWMPKDYAMDIIAETAGFYDDLMSGKTPNTKELSLE